MKLPDPSLIGRRIGGDSDSVGSSGRPRTGEPRIADFSSDSPRPAQGAAEMSGLSVAARPARLSHAFSWLAPATAACVALAALAGSTFGDRPGPLAAAVVTVALAFLLLLWGSGVWLLRGGEAPTGASSELQAALLAAREKGEQLRNLAYRDSLTGLPNRSLFDDRLALAIRHASRERSLLAVLFLDLDGFKAVNDFQGHSFGDRLLVALAERIDASVRAEDTVARLGGDEFVVLLPKVAGPADAASVAAKILDALQAPFQIDGGEVSMSASIGVSVFPHDGRSAEVLVSKADRAMYRAKEIRRRVRQQLDVPSDVRQGQRFGIDGIVPANP